MSLLDEFLQKLNCERQDISYEYLQTLVDSFLIHCPYESLSKILIRQTKGVYLPSFDEFMKTNLETGLGGTCFTLNSAFHALVTELGFHSEILPADADAELSAHLVSKITLEDEAFIVDFGLMGPFVGPYPFKAGAHTEMQLGKTRYTYECDGKKFVTHIYRDKCRAFRSQEKSQDLGYFQPALENSFTKDSLFMKTIATYKHFPDHGAGIWQNEFHYMQGEHHEMTVIPNISEMERIYREELNLPKYPVRAAVAAISEYTGVDVFSPSN